MKAIKLERTDLNGFVSILRRERLGRMHHRRKIGIGRAVFVTAKVSASGAPMIHGRVTGPSKNHADYEISLVETNGTIQIRINLEDPNGTYTIERAYADIVHGVTEMMKNPKKSQFAGRDTSRLKGFYLKSTGKNNVGDTGKRTLTLAVSEGHISDQFRSHCIKVGFTMERF